METTAHDKLNKFHLLLCTNKSRKYVVFEQMFEVKMRSNLDIARCFCMTIPCVQCN